MEAGLYDIVIQQGATWRRTLTWFDDEDDENSQVDLTGFTAALQIRTEAFSDEVILSLTEGAGITLGGSAGTIAMLIDAEDTDMLDAGIYAWDLELTSAGGEVTRLLEGKATVRGQVTREVTP